MKKIIPQDAVLIPDRAQLVFEGVIYNVFQWPQEQFDGSAATFEMLKRPDTTVVIGVVDDHILVLREEQPHNGHRASFPGGRVDPEDESIQHAAEREMEEETGYSFRNWRLLLVYQPHTKIEWFVHIWLAWDVIEKINTHLDAGEKITVQTLTLEEVKALVAKKDGYLGEAQGIFEEVTSLEDLLALSEFKGQEVDR